MKNLYGKFIRRHGWLAVWYIMAAFWHAAVTLLIPVVMAQGIANLLAFNSARAGIFTLLPEAIRPDTPARWFGVFPALLMAYGVLNWVSGRLLALTGETFVYELRAQVFEKQLKIRQEVYVREGTGRFLPRWSGGFSALRNGLTRGVLRAAADASLMLLGLLGLVVLLPEIWYWPVVGAVVLLVVASWPGGLGVMLRRYRDEQAALLRYIHERLGAIASIRAFRLEATERTRFHRRIMRLRDFAVQYRTSETGYKGFMRILAYLPAFLLLVGASFRPGTAQPGDLLAAYFLLVALNAVIRRMARVHLYWRKAALAWERLTVFLGLDETQAVLHQPDAIAADAQLIQLASDTTDAQSLPGWHYQHYLTGQEREEIVRSLAGLAPVSPRTASLAGLGTAYRQSTTLHTQVAVASTLLPLIGRTPLEAVITRRGEKARLEAESVLAEALVLLPPELPLTADTRLRNIMAIPRLQQQVLVLVRALLARRDILVLDDVWSGMPPALEAWARKTISRYVSDGLICLDLIPGPEVRFPLPDLSPAAA
ncbi:MAG: ABC transporter transmembrane domain-containing protein [Bacteroidia bacterium]|nr:ABC transporter transmembrane domain-containing protein [Bacteroidia bacterium]